MRFERFPMIRWSLRAAPKQPKTTAEMPKSWIRSVEASGFIDNAKADIKEKQEILPDHQRPISGSKHLEEGPRFRTADDKSSSRHNFPSD